MSKVTQPQRNLQTYEQDLAKRKNNNQIDQAGEEEDLNNPIQDEEPFDEENIANNFLQADFNHIQKNEQIYQEEDQIPLNKNQLIEFLKNRLETSDVAMANLYVAIEIERQKRETLCDQFEEKKLELDDINESEGAFFRMKVETRMTPALQRALEDRVIAENERAQLEIDFAERELMIKELDDTLRMTHREKCQKEIEADECQYRVNEQESIVDNYHVEIKKVVEKNNIKDNEIEALTAEINDMKNVVETLILMRDKLNYYIPDEGYGNEKQFEKVLRTQTPEGLTGFYIKANPLSSRRDAEKEAGRSFEDNTSNHDIPKEDEFWYAEVLAQKKLIQQKKGSQDNLQPWQPKVQDQNKTLPQISDFKTTQHNTSLPTIKLPVLNREKAEYLHKNQEFIDEFADNSKDKTKKKTYKVIYNKKKAYDRK